jgi:hypothetical protein
LISSQFLKSSFGETWQGNVSKEAMAIYLHSDQIENGKEEPPVTSCSPLASKVRQTLTSMTKILTSSITEFFLMQQVSQGNLLGGTLVKFCQEFFSKSIILKEGKLN